MSETAIRVEGLGKEYRVGASREKYKTLRDSITNTAVGAGRALQSLVRRGDNGSAAESSFWALKDASFEVKQGEVVGIIGRNGAGKSTLLKILSRITEPSEGFAEIHGRIGSLLEVGTGFHPELTGRENISMNGAILGMKHAEIERKFDDIVAFAEVEKFIDTPVKHYSSGMHLRLGFAVAAHLEPEIMIVDEVLAVGDAVFQNKCMGKMNDVAQQGRTVLFVSHNMAAIQNLCTRAILLRKGQVALDGPVDDVIRHYLAGLTKGAKDPFGDNPERNGDGSVRLVSARVLDESDQPTEHLVAGRAASFEFDYENLAGASRASAIMTIYNQMGVAVTNLNMNVTNYTASELGPRGRFVCHIPKLPLPLGQYRVSVGVRVGGQVTDLIPNVLVFDVESSTFYSSGRTPPTKNCTCMVEHEWRHDIAR